VLTTTTTVHLAHENDRHDRAADAKFGPERRTPEKCRKTRKSNATKAVSTCRHFRPYQVVRSSTPLGTFTTHQQRSEEAHRCKSADQLPLDRQRAAPDVSLPCEGAPVSPSATATYTTVRMLEKSRNLPRISISFHVQTAFPAGSCDPHLIPASRNPIRTARLRRLKTSRGNLCDAKYTANPPMFTSFRRVVRCLATCSDRRRTLEKRASLMLPRLCHHVGIFDPTKLCAPRPRLGLYTPHRQRSEGARGCKGNTSTRTTLRPAWYLQKVKSPAEEKKMEDFCREFGIIRPGWMCGGPQRMGMIFSSSH